MNRQILKTNYGENYLRYAVHIHSDPSPGEEQAGYAALASFMQSIASQPELLRHIGPCPETVTYSYEGGRWKVEAVTIVPRPSED